ncbi:MAG: Rne/Rng family ribonuclease [Parvularculaceae bacterium]
MTKKMLIDAANKEEVRVCLLENGKVEDFDFEFSSKKPLRGNIYLARVTRVEPSLQAAFIEYGGNRHGFLAFNEIHPDYYQIPVSDREAIQAAEREEAELAARLNLNDAPDEDDPQRGFNGGGANRVDDDASADDGEADAGESDGRRAPRRRPRRAAPRRDESEGRDDVRADADDRADAPDDEADREAADQGAADGDGADAERRTNEAGEIEALGSADADADEGDRGGGDPEDGGSDGDDPNDDGSGRSVPMSAGDGPSDKLVGPEVDDDADGSDDAENDHPENVDDVTIEARQLEPEAAIEETDDEADDLSEDDAFVDEDTAEYGEDDGVDDYDDDVAADDDEDDVAARDADDEDDDFEANGETRAELMKRYEAARRRRQKLLRNYKIQEVVKRRQILLVQVVKEERGNKGAAMTTHLSLAGRYCVLMPNTPRGGGISRKIPSASDRKRLRGVVDSLDVPQGMGLIIRTAGAKRTKAEIKRDYDYLTRLWETIRELTLKSIAPALIYEEASLIKRAIRDLYDKDISSVLVEGEAGYREAKDFMKMLMPSHAKNVQPYKDPAPLFLRHDVERQLDAMYQPIVRLKSGGYLVINQTEALIAIDVNSGKATRERNIEQTALKTNLEAAKEVARQCRLRDLAGLLVIDFIDMEEHRNNRAVEKRLKDALKTDRARLQVGRISGFGLLEMSRQRRRSGIIDGTTTACPTCGGGGAVRSPELAGLRILRALEAEAIDGRAEGLRVRASLDVTLYILNHKRDWLNRIETAYGVAIEIVADAEKSSDQHDIEPFGGRREAPISAAVQADLSSPAEDADDADDVDAEDDDGDDDARAAGDDEADEGGRGRRRRRRRRRRRGDDAADAAGADDDNSSDDDDDADGARQQADAGGEDGEDRPRRRRRRGRRGGRRNARDRDDNQTATGDDAAQSASADGDAQPDGANAGDRPSPRAADAGEQAPAANGAAASPADARHETADDRDVGPVEVAAADDADDAREDDAAQSEPAVGAGPLGAPTPPPNDDAPEKPKSSRKGWWQRALGG